MGIKYKVNEKFFYKWSPKMAYVLGYIYADGSIHESNRGSYLSISSIDEKTIKKIRSWLSSGHKIYKMKFAWQKRRNQYVLRIGDREIYNSLLHHGIFPNKSLTVIFPKVPKKYLNPFILGYFDGDGCIYLYRSPGKTQKLILRKLSVIFTSGSKKFLEGLLKALRNNLQIKQTKVYLSHRSFQLRFATADSVKLFKFMYQDSSRDLFLRRKYDIFQKYFMLKRPSGEVV